MNDPARQVRRRARALAKEGKRGGEDKGGREGLLDWGAGVSSLCSPEEPPPTHPAPHHPPPHPYPTPHPPLLPRNKKRPRRWLLVWRGRPPARPSQKTPASPRGPPPAPPASGLEAGQGAEGARPGPCPLSRERGRGERGRSRQWCAALVICAAADTDRELGGLVRAQQRLWQQRIGFWGGFVWALARACVSVVLGHRWRARTCGGWFGLVGGDAAGEWRGGGGDGRTANGEQRARANNKKTSTQKKCVAQSWRAPFFGAFDSIGAGQLSFHPFGSEEGDLAFVKAKKRGGGKGEAGVAPLSALARSKSRARRFTL